MSEAASTFTREVWPRTRWADRTFACVEGSEIDTHHGVDQILRFDSFLVTLAVRVQRLAPDEKVWSTFTIRYQRIGGDGHTEYDKLLAGESYATHYLQAYVDRGSGRLLAFATTRTVDLIPRLDTRRIRTNRNEEGRPVEFLWVPWSECPLVDQVHLAQAWAA